MGQCRRIGGDSPSRCLTTAFPTILFPWKDVAGKTRVMADEFINAEADGVTTAFYNYCRPLIGSSVPEPHRLRAPRVPLLPD